MSSVLIQQSKPSFFVTLLETTDASRHEFEAIPKMNAMLTRGLALPEYRAFLHDLYHVVWHFCPIIAAAASRMGDRFPQVRAEFYDRIAEERGHENWVLEDVQAVGGDVDYVRTRAPSAPLQCMVAFNYYCAERAHPCAVLGMLYSLEVIASAYAMTLAQSIAKAIDRDVDGPGFRFLLSHSAMDQEHVAKLNVLVKTIDDPAAQEAVISATRVNFYQFGRVFYDGGFTSLIG